MITEDNVKYAKKYCRDDISKIPGYDRAISEDGQFLIHHVLELTMDGKFAHTPDDLERLGMYWNRPYYELQWMERGEHTVLHLTGEQNPVWTNGIQGAYRIALRKFKEGLISETELQEYRDAWNSEKKRRAKQKSI